MVLYNPLADEATVVGRPGEGTGHGEVLSTTIIAIDPDGNVAVYDLARSSIELYSPTGEPVRRIQLPLRVTWVKGFVILPSGELPQAAHRSTAAPRRPADPAGPTRSPPRPGRAGTAAPPARPPPSSASAFLRTRHTSTAPSGSAASRTRCGIPSVGPASDFARPLTSSSRISWMNSCDPPPLHLLQPPALHQFSFYTPFGPTSAGKAGFSAVGEKQPRPTTGKPA